MTRLLLPSRLFQGVRPATAFSHNHQLSVLGMALAFALSFASNDASAISLGRLNVQSELGEPLRAEIEVTDIGASEAEGLKVSIRSPESFNTSGIPYSTTLSDLRVSLQRRADGRYAVRLNGSKAMNDPFIALLLEVNWSSGRIVRDYTALLDPPVARQALAPVRPTAAQTDLVPLSRSAAPAPRAATAATPAVAKAPTAPARRQSPTRVARVEPSAVQANPGEQITVQRGDTASNIAAAYKPADVSLDQMLVALLRRNADAFVDGNVNRVKSGSVLALPSDAQVRFTTPQEATGAIKTQSNDFRDYRRRLADNAPASPSNGTNRQASGKLQASVEERNGPGNSPDKLKITQDNTASTAADDKLAQSRQAQAESSRTAELAKNLDDVKKLQAASGAAPGPTATVSATAALEMPAAGAVPPAPVAAVAVAAAPEVVAAPVLVTATQSGFFASLLHNPLTLGLAALVAALPVFFLYRVWGRRRLDSVFFEDKAPHDSFFGVSNDQQADASDRHLSVVSSAAYSTSQLDSGDVDPVADADVYLAYGRDLQAEEILREAMRTDPERVAVPLKLLKIHAKRRDLRAFESVASDIHNLTGGAGFEWAHAAEMGRDLDPGNVLYQPVAAPLPLPPIPPSPPPPFVHSVTRPSFDLDPPDFLAPVTSVHGAPQSTQSKESNFIEFDMDSLSNPTSGLPDSRPLGADATEHASEHPYAITLALARELHVIGDIDGALSLIRQVANESSGELQIEARHLLTQWAK